MKKITLFATIFAALALNAQNVIYEEDFESYTVGDNVGEDTDIPTTFLSYDVDGDGYNWGLTKPTNFTQDMYLIYDGNFIMSASYITLGANNNGGQGALNANNILVFPKISIPAGATDVELTYFVAGGTSSNFFSETYYVTVTTGNTQAEILAATPIYSETLPTYLGRTINLDLNPYIGQDIYLAFRHQTSDQWMLGLDDLRVTAGTLSIGDNEFQGFTYFLDNNNQMILKADKPMSDITLYNVLGQVVISKKLSEVNETLNLSTLNSGVYIVKIAIDGQNKSFKIVKR
ncbi:Cleaved Adhesin Domain protein [Aequorivita sublithincola DSM 14238]|uniref:Cleaved Adhesin Domain protein n=1 Tax=Aequorivita sublithincola (strain DSM 14238 / LMG 21431 / ACAM 643 / 9-3) TaxID=746697 RepID=I3YRL2_AEQSU|nr:T9SS type A sorting domain-containing protein [Aequorivita sublithincola]AFL79630.1 Cleaved Adhesin Domain protein [Aequorivita sublithincola DSM 14238]